MCRLPAKSRSRQSRPPSAGLKAGPGLCHRRRHGLRDRAGRGHGRVAGRGGGRRRAGAGGGGRGPPLPAHRAGPDRAGPGRLVAVGRQLPAVGRPPGRPDAAGRRPVRPDGRTGANRRGRPGSGPLPHLGGLPGYRRMRPDHRPDRRRAADRGGGQARRARLHRGQAAVAQDARARPVRRHPPRLAAQGLPALAAGRGHGHRPVRRVQHAALRRDPAALVPGPRRRAGCPGSDPARRRRAGRGHCSGDRSGGLGHRAGRGRASGGRGRGLDHRGRGQLAAAWRPGADRARVGGQRERRVRPAADRPGRPRAHRLLRDRGQLDRDRRTAGGRPGAAVAAWIPAPSRTSRAGRAAGGQLRRPHRAGQPGRPGQCWGDVPAAPERQADAGLRPGCPRRVRRVVGRPHCRAPGPGGHGGRGLRPAGIGLRAGRAGRASRVRPRVVRDPSHRAAA
jgi:hypothetical protein